MSEDCIELIRGKIYLSAAEPSPLDALVFSCWDTCSMRWEAATLDGSRNLFVVTFAASSYYGVYPLDLINQVVRHFGGTPCDRATMQFHCKVRDGLATSPDETGYCAAVRSAIRSAKLMPPAVAKALEDMPANAADGANLMRFLGAIGDLSSVVAISYGARCHYAGIEGPFDDGSVYCDEEFALYPTTHLFHEATNSMIGNHGDIDSVAYAIAKFVYQMTYAPESRHADLMERVGNLLQKPVELQRAIRISD